ncbi:8119_t:CDS:1, partial [Scutellospora calospora]
IADSSQYVYPYLPSTNALRQTIQRICHLDLPTEPVSLESLIIPEYLRKTLDRSDFLINDTTISHNRMLIFTTPNNIRYLNQFLYWIMDRTFKTVPIIFKQLYTIHSV